jgi:hypothetical protein
VTKLPEKVGKNRQVKVLIPNAVSIPTGKQFNLIQKKKKTARLMTILLAKETLIC